MSQSRDLSRLEKPAEEVTAVTTSHTAERQRKYYVLPSPEKQIPVSTKKSSRTTGTTKRQSRGKRTSRTDVSYSEDEAAEIERQEKNKGAKRKTRNDLSAHGPEMDLPLTVTTAIQAKTTRVQRTLQSSVPETSTPQTEERVYEGRVTTTRTAARTGRERVSKYYEDEAKEESQQSSSSNRRRNRTSRLQREAKEPSPEMSESGESSESDNTRREMQKTLSSARSKKGKQTAVKAKSPAKSNTTTKKQAPKEIATKTSVQVTTDCSVTDSEDNETLASLQEKRSKEKAMTRAGQKKDRDEVGRKYTWVQVHSQSEEEMFVTQKSATAEDSQMTATQQSHPETDDEETDEEQY